MGLFDGLLGSAVSGVSSLFGASKQNSSAKQIAAENNRLAVELASNQHQREVADLKAAGLNPILSAGGGGSAVPQLTAAPVQNELAGASEAVNTGLRSAQVKAQLDNLKADTALKSENATLAKENQGVATEMRQKTVTDYWKADAEKNLTRQLEVNAKKDNLKKDKEIQLIEAQTNSARNSSRISGIEADSAETMGEMYRNLEKGGSMAKGLVGGAKVLKDIFSSTPAATKLRRPYVH